VGGHINNKDLDVLAPCVVHSAQHDCAENYGPESSMERVLFVSGGVPCPVEYLKATSPVLVQVLGQKN
jgi:hypothetical protein